MISNSFKNTYFLLFFLFFFSLISCDNIYFSNSVTGNILITSAHRIRTLGLDVSCEQSKSSKLQVHEDAVLEILPGAQQTNLYLKLLASKNVAVIANQTSVIFKDQKDYTHLVDSLLLHEIKVSKVFSPEHGFRGDADAGEKVIDGIDSKTGIPIISLYGSNKKPSKEQLKNIDVVVFDIQDVGVRFYTYISTLHYVMEACAEQGIPIIVLDRPNPNGHYIDGPTLEIEHTSFVGMHPIPIVYGMTIGEYAQMINGENWLKNNVKCDLTVIPLKNYNHSNLYSLPIKPSPNLPNDKAINLYPSLCFFEGTNVSVGRGTEKQFQIFGSPFIKTTSLNYCFTPQPNNGAKHPMHENIECCGFDLSNNENLHKIELSYLIEAYSLTEDKSKFFNNFFTRLAGTTKLQEQLENNNSAEEIYNSWKPNIESFKKMRAKYLLYK